MITPSPWRGIAALLLAAASFVTTDVFMKASMAELPPFEVLMLRGVAASVWCLPVLLLLGFGPQLAQGLNPWVLLRAASETLAVLIFVFTLKRMPLGDLTALTQTAPLFLVLGAGFFWREPIGIWRVLLVVSGFAGAVMVAQPGAVTASVYAPLGLCAAVFGAGRDLLSRKVPPEVPALVATFATILMVMLAAVLCSLLFETWVPPRGVHLQMLGAAGLLLMGAHFLLMQAFRLARAGTLAPFLYGFTVWAMLAGIVIFGDRPNSMGLAGVALIIASGLAVAMLDGRTRRVLNENGRPRGQERPSSAQ